MKILVSLLFCSVTLTFAAQEEIVLRRLGKNVNEPPSPALTTNVIALLQSCSVSSTAYAVREETWRDLQHSNSFVHLKFATPKKLKVMLTPGTGKRDREDVVIDQILVPLPEGALPSHIFALSGTNVLSFTKYDPMALKRVALEPAMRLSSVAPYRSLIDILPPEE